MVPKIEQAKQVRASMTLQAQDIPSDRTLPREGVFIIFRLIIYVGVSTINPPFFLLYKM